MNEQKYCTNCGSLLYEDDNFCSRCGKPVKKAVTQSSKTEAAEDNGRVETVENNSQKETVKENADNNEKKESNFAWYGVVFLSLAAMAFVGFYAIQNDTTMILKDARGNAWFSLAIMGFAIVGLIEDILSLRIHADKALSIVGIVIAVLIIMGTVTVTNKMHTEWVNGEVMHWGYADHTHYLEQINDFMNDEYN